MPKPRPVGNAAKAVLEAITSELAKNQGRVIDVVIAIQRGDQEAAMGALREIAANENLSVRALTFVLANQVDKADSLLIEAKLAKRGGNE